MNNHELIRQAILLENQLLSEQAEKLKKAREQLENISKPFSAHWVYVYILPNSDSYKHWKNELATYCEAVGSIRIKPNNKKLFRNDIVGELLQHIDTDIDAHAEIVSAWAFHATKSNSLPSLEELGVNSKTDEGFRKFKNDVNDTLEELFLNNREDFSKEYYQQVIDDLVQKWTDK